MKQFFNKANSSRALAITLALVLTVAFGVRMYEALTPDEYVSEDEAAYQSLAATIYLNGSFGGPPAKTSDPERWAPGAPALFALSFAVRGGISPTAARIAQAAVGTLLVLIVYLIAVRLSRRRSAGLVAAALLAVYPPIAKVTGDLLSEPLGALLLALGTLLLLRSIDELRAGLNPRTHLWLALSGFAFGLAALTRADYLLLPLVLIPVVIAASWNVSGERGARWTRRLVPPLLLVAAFLLALAPWSIRNTVKEDRLVTVTTGGATPLFLGTYLPGDGGRAGAKENLRAEAESIHPSIRGEPTFRIPAQFIMDAVARRHPELSRNEAIALEARKNLRRYALGEPIRFTGMTIRKIPRMWDRPYDGGRYPASRPLRLLHLGYLAFGLAGLALLLTASGRRLPALAVLAVIAYGTAMHLLVVAFPRYNLPLMPLLIALGAAGVVPAATSFVRNKRSVREVRL